MNVSPSLYNWKNASISLPFASKCENAICVALAWVALFQTMCPLDTGVPGGIPVVDVFAW
jgi:hypothetical protein